LHCFSLFLIFHFFALLSFVQKYAPDVDTAILVKLTKAFSELRTMADEARVRVRVGQAIVHSFSSFLSNL